VVTLMSLMSTADISSMCKVREVSASLFFYVLNDKGHVVRFT
jgi:hypothetical protein